MSIFRGVARSKPMLKRAGIKIYTQRQFPIVFAKHGVANNKMLVSNLHSSCGLKYTGNQEEYTASVIGGLADKELFKYEFGVGTKEKFPNTFEVCDPSTGSTIGHLPNMTAEDTRKMIDLAHDTQKEWAKTTIKERKIMLMKWFNLILKNKDDLARILSLESGKPYKEAVGEVLYGASFIEWFAEEAQRAYGDTIPMPGMSKQIITLRQPVGVAGMITPWNFPLAMITPKAGAAIAAGCTVVIKPAAETPYSAIALEQLAIEAGIPRGVINTVLSQDSAEVGKEITENTKVKKISFTGSTNVGKLLMKQSSSTIKKMSMELGGNAPFIVFGDANLSDAVDGLIACKFRNAGQTCVSANRIFVHEKVYDEFIDLVTQKVKTLVVGRGMDSNTDVGPLISSKAVEKVEHLVNDAVSKGARLVYGGKRVDVGDGKDNSVSGSTGGNFYMPTILADVPLPTASEMLVSTCEIFGPVLAISKFGSDNKASQEQSYDGLVNAVNSAEVGLAGYFYSRDIGTIFKVAEALEVGMVGVNTGIISSEVIPFGGVKMSGFGKEGSKYGLNEYLNIKSIVLNY